MIEDYDMEFSTEGTNTTCVVCGRVLTDIEIEAGQCDDCDPFLDSEEERGLNRKNWMSFEQFCNLWVKLRGYLPESAVADFYDDWMTGTDEPAEKYIKGR